MSARELARGTVGELLGLLPPDEPLHSQADGQEHTAAWWLHRTARLGGGTWVLWVSRQNYGREWIYTLGLPGMMVLRGTKRRGRNEEPAE